MNLKALFVQTVTLPADPRGADAERPSGQLASLAGPVWGWGEEEEEEGRARAHAPSRGGGQPPTRPGRKG